MRLEARSRDGWVRGVHRVAAPHVRARAPHLVHVDERLWSRRPHVAARRLGLQFELDLRDNLQRVLFFTGRYEPAVTAFLRRSLRPGDTVLDIGAHIGVHSLTAARRLGEVGGGRVVAFEPAPDSAANLRRAAERNGLDVEVVTAAAGACAGTIELRASTAYDPADAGVRSSEGDGPVVAAVPVVAVDAWLAEHGSPRVDVVKIDVEGAETEVLDGMRSLLGQGCVRALIVETKGHTGADEIAAHLRASGYVATAELPLGNALFTRA